MLAVVIVVMVMGGLFVLRVLPCGVVGHWLYGFLQHGIGKGVFFLFFPNLFKLFSRFFFFFFFVLLSCVVL